MVENDDLLIIIRCQVWILAGAAASKLVLHISNVRQGARVFASTDCATGWNMNSMVPVHGAEPNAGTDSKHQAAHDRQFTTCSNAAL